MFVRIARSWRIFKNSLVVLNEHRKLLLFPALSMALLLCFGLLVFSGIVGLVMTHPELMERFGEAQKAGGPLPMPKDMGTGMNILAACAVFAAYFVSVFMATFFNVAFYSEILRGLKAEPVSLGRGFKFALSKCGSIALWALLAGTVGVILMKLEERLGWIGVWIVRLLGLAWNVVTVFAVPVIICEPESLNPIRNLKKSAAIIRETWGESLVGFVGISALGGLLVLPVVVVVIVAAAAAAINGIVVLAVAIAVLGVAAVVTLMVLLDVAKKIYVASLYLYATEKVLVPAYDEELMLRPFKTRK